MEQDKKHNIDERYVRELERTVVQLKEELRIANVNCSVNVQERNCALSSLAESKDVNSILDFRNCQLHKLALHALHACFLWRARFLQVTLEQFEKPDAKMLRHRNELLVWSAIFEDAWKRDVKKFRSFFPQDFMRRMRERHNLEGVNHG